MKTIFIFLVMVVLSGCATKVVQPLPPTDNALKSSYRKTVEVIAVDCVKHRVRGRMEEVTVVEMTSTGERFHVNGCLGHTGERFRISY